ncbi:sulfite exporter TauE/SafE family protein [Streptomyces sp. ACA25]|uniref:sulfite exporter TauE/SafE family protein n=1 Tax=Streptomyces sp. ACA25 TaxID=3022596 RepID=UPI0023079740|nr:sulfite exporter TauE/SafE family protein [Streptomyces sp. ACA25]MDB1088136.1 sulfite exporter TauE/SafE family protein [Streptomyces sp. ACA25]
MPEISFLLIAGLAVFLGSVVQSGVGLGLGLVAAPVVAFVEPALVPGTLLVTAAVLPMLTVRSEWQHIDWRGVAWGLPARVPGAAAGVWLVAVVDPRTLGAVVGLVVLLAVAATLWSVRVPLTPVSLITAGAASGLSGTATSIGGPPLALLYQHEPAPRVRGTLGAFFLLGTLMSLAALAIGGQLPREQVFAGLVLIPFVIAGYLAGGPVRSRVGVRGVRAALLVVVTVSGVALITRSLL